MSLRAALLLALASSFTACGQGSPDVPGVIGDAGDDTSATDAALEADAAPLEPFPVVRLACVGTSSLAKDLPPGEPYGALEGELVSLVPPGTKGCPEDPDHLHLQVRVGTKRYDVAVNIDSTSHEPLGFTTKSFGPAQPPQGWAAETFDYPRDLGIVSADFEKLDKAALLARLMKELSTAARIRVYGRAYADGTGLHNIHRNGKDRDGGLLIRRANASGDRFLGLRFATDVF
ncbi:MAG: hypothetical protein IPJ34_17420 [Myxococcales bacterium]|nr:hypothetical protein [Myxococcales bacterium]